MAYEREYSPSSSLLPSQSLLQETLRRSRSFVTLSEYVMNELSNQAVIYLDADAWQQVQNSEFVTDSTVFGRAGYVPLKGPGLADAESERGFLARRDQTGFKTMRYAYVPALEYGRHSVPEALRFPQRAQQAPLAAGIMAAGIGAMLVLPVERRIAQSSLATLTAVLAVLLAAALLLVAWPFLYGLVGHDAGYASILIGGLLLIASGLGLALVGRQIAMVNRLFGGQNVLMQWTFTPRHWAEYSRQRQNDRRASQTLLWMLVTMMALVIIAVFWFADGSSSVVLPLVVIVLASALWRALLQWGWNRKQLAEQEQPGEIVIGYDGLYAAGDVHRWSGLGTRLHGAVVCAASDSKEPWSPPTVDASGLDRAEADGEEVGLEQGGSMPESVHSNADRAARDRAAVLRIEYAVFSAYSMGGRGVPVFFWHDVGLEIPVPPDKIGEARRAAALLRETYRL